MNPKLEDALEEGDKGSWIATAQGVRSQRAGVVTSYEDVVPYYSKPAQDAHYKNSSADSALGEKSSMIWSTYVGESEKYDKALVESWKGDMDGILIFAGLFSAVVTAFLVQCVATLQPASGQASGVVLNKIVAQLDKALGNSSYSPSDPIPAGNTPSSPTGSPIRVNILWLISLLLSLLCALGAILIQQWARIYIQSVERRSAPRQRARIRSFLFRGIEVSGVRGLVNGIPTLLHAAVFLFIAGMYDFFLPYDGRMAILAICALCLYGFLYVIISLAPLGNLSTPYQTPLSAGLWRVRQLFWPLRYRRFHDGHIIFPNGNLVLIREEYAMHASAQNVERDTDALSWTLNSLMGHAELERFVAGIPGFLDSERSESNPGAMAVMHSLLQQNDMGSRLTQLLETCMDPASGIAREYRRQRACTIFHATRSLITSWEQLGEGVHHWQWAMCFGPRMLEMISNLSAASAQDMTINFHAHCTGALVLHKLLDDYDLLVFHARAELARTDLQSLSKTYTARGPPRSRAERSKHAKLAVEVKRVEAMSAIRSEIVRIRNSTALLPWVTSMHQLLETLGRCLGAELGHEAYRSQLPSIIDVRGKLMDNQTLREDALATSPSELDQGKLGIMIKIVNHLSLHATALLRLLDMDDRTFSSDEDLIAELEAFFPFWLPSAREKDTIQKMVFSCHATNTAQFVVAVLDDCVRLNRAEQSLVLRTLDGILPPPSIATYDHGVQVALLAFLHHFKLEHEKIVPTTSAQTDGTGRFLVDLAGRMFLMVARIVTDPELLVQMKRFLSNYSRRDIASAVQRALAVVADKLPPSQVVRRRVLFKESRIERMRSNDEYGEDSSTAFAAIIAQVLGIERAIAWQEYAFQATQEAVHQGINVPSPSLGDASPAHSTNNIPRPAELRTQSREGSVSAVRTAWRTVEKPSGSPRAKEDSKILRGTNPESLLFRPIGGATAQVLNSVRKNSEGLSTLSPLVSVPLTIEEEEHSASPEVEQGLGAPHAPAPHPQILMETRTPSKSAENEAGAVDHGTDEAARRADQDADKEMNPVGPVDAHSDLSPFPSELMAMALEHEDSNYSIGGLFASPAGNTTSLMTTESGLEEEAQQLHNLTSRDDPVHPMTEAGVGQLAAEQSHQETTDRFPVDATMEELRKHNSGLEAMFLALADDLTVTHQDHRDEILQAVRSTAKEQMVFNIQSYLEGFNELLRDEERMLLRPVAELWEARCVLQSEIQTLISLRGTYTPGNERDIASTGTHPSELPEQLDEPMSSPSPKLPSLSHAPGTPSEDGRATRGQQH